MAVSQSDDTKNRYQLLVESVQDYAIYLCDTSGYIETWNIGAELIKGYSADEIVGKHISLFYPPGDAISGKPDRDLLIAAEDSHTEDQGWRVKKDGSRFWADVTITALRDKGDSLINFAIITKDITDKKRSNNALVAANKLLKYQHVEMEALNNIKDEFVTLASHQLRTPATGIKQFLGLLLEGYAGELSSQQTEYIKKAYNSNERQIDLVNSLLRTAQVDAGRVSLNKTFANLPTMIREVVEGLHEVFENRHQTVSIQGVTQMTDIYIDEARMRMVLENLIDNASKYTEPNGRIVITLSETKGHVALSVKDTGVGISDANIKHVFEKFNRIPNKLSDSVGGTGLGLYWAKKIVVLHKGTIKVNSQLDIGTEFIVRLPKGIVRV